MITSTRNPKIQWVRTLNRQPRARREEQVFVIEGVRLLEEAHQHGWYPTLILYCEDLSPRGFSLVNNFQHLGIQVEQVAPHVLKAAVDTETPQGLLAVLPVRELSLPPRPTFILILDMLRDPGNLGTILRTAAAAAVDAVLLTTGTVDPFSSKVLRAGMGVHFHLPIHTWQWEVILKYLGDVDPGNRPRICLAEVGAGRPHTSMDFTQPIALVVGGEADGASEYARRVADELVHISLPGQVESLNAGIAAGILLFEVVRQRNLTRSS